MWLGGPTSAHISPLLQTIAKSVLVNLSLFPTVYKPKGCPNIAVPILSAVFFSNKDRVVIYCYITSYNIQQKAMKNKEEEKA